MPANRPETRRAHARGAAAVSGWLLCAAGLILCAAPSAGWAADPPSPATGSGGKSAGSPVAKSAATTSAVKTAAATPASKPAAAAAASKSAPTNRPATGPERAAGNPRTTQDSTFGAGEAGAAGSTAAAAKGAPHAATPGSAVRPTHTGAGPTPAGTTPARLAAASAGKSHGVQTVAHLDQKLTYQYNALGRRDPFQPMIGGEFVGADVGGDAPIDVGGMKVVGVVWGTEDKFAMVEDGRGQSLVLRVGDKVMNGVVEGLRRDAVVVRITADGQTQSVTIPLTRKGDKSNATR